MNEANPGNPNAEEETSSGQVSQIRQEIAEEKQAVSAVLDTLPGQPTGREVSASTIGRMMGLATLAEISLLESKLDAMGSRLNSFGQRLDKILAWIGRAPTGTDLERIDVQIGALRSLIKDTMAGVAADSAGARESGSASKKGGVKIMTNTAPEAKSGPASASTNGEG